MTQGMLFSQMTPPSGREDEFHSWYNTDHIPARMDLAGFAAANRYENVEHPGNFLAVYDLSDLGVLETPEYQQLKREPSALTHDMLNSVSGFTRYTTELIFETSPRPVHDAFLYVVAFDVPEVAEEEFHGWYEEEHIPLLMKVPGWRAVRRFVTRGSYDGPAITHFALHYLDSLDALEAPERDAARDTPRREALAGQPWFSALRWVYRPIFHAASRKDN